MTEPLSRSEMKRRAKAVEDLARELVSLPDRDIAKLPCEPDIREEVRMGRSLQDGGARKRQIKYITRLLRDEPHEELLAFLQGRRGSRLSQVKEEHEIEHTRDLFINEAIRLYEEPLLRETLMEPGRGYRETPPLPDGMREELEQEYLGVEAEDLWNLAWQFARSRKIGHSREIFRILKAAKERQRFGGKGQGKDER